MAISLLAYVVTFSGQLYFRRSYLEVTAFRVTTLTQQLLFLGSHFFRASACFEELLFQNSHFIAAVIFSQQLLFQSETSTEQPLLENRKFFRVVTFRNNYLFGGGIVWNNVSTEELLFRSRYFCTASTFSEELHFGKKLISQKRNIPHYTFFSGELPFQNGYFFKRLAFTVTLSIDHFVINLLIPEFLDSNHPEVHRVLHHSEDFFIKYYEQIFSIKFAFSGSTEQDYLSNNVKNFSFWGVL